MMAAKTIVGPNEILLFGILMLNFTENKIY